MTPTQKNQINQLPIAQIVTQNPETSRVFEKFNIDFCCGGKRTLADVLSSDNDKLEQVSTSIFEMLSYKRDNGLVPFDTLSLAELISYIEQKHHTYVKESIPVIMGNLKKVVEKHGDKHRNLFQIFDLFSELTEELLEHMKKEEFILFPQILETEQAYQSGNPANESFQIQLPVIRMETEHETVRILLEEIRFLTTNYSPPVYACTTFKLSYKEMQDFEFDLHKHIHLENNILFPKAVSMSLEMCSK